ncbi:heptaprenyl diphosphate synthase [Peptostreptococcus russellii]|uniref:Heptaprenyl diphosphate synthase n=1 Tax=Peptostreptococcus russellii TaxID=215200 RepID=A0A2P7Q280_9FIRM|nr:Gx transporter family protein [Peptostreptococcus russellii]PSJ32068.1 heptaprenyl diphosphate synthase [Peptostreptococcus russellii]
MKKNNTQKLILLSLMVAYSLALYILETFIPNPLVALFPGAKLGLSNIITLICLLNFGFKDTFTILSVRIILSSIFAGPVSYLLFSIAGGYLSLAGMYLASKIKGFSIIGVSLCGAIMHNIGQLLMAAMIIENLSMISYLPFMLGASIVTGVFIGIVVKFANDSKAFSKIKTQ